MEEAGSIGRMIFEGQIVAVFVANADVLVALVRTVYFVIKRDVYLDCICSLRNKEEHLPVESLVTRIAELSIFDKLLPNIASRHANSSEHLRVKKCRGSQALYLRNDEQYSVFIRGRG